MRFSIITATKNNKAGLLRAIECVRNQTYKQVEHIIVDGGSTDGSEELLREMQSSSNQKLVNSKEVKETILPTTYYTLHTISEADSGIYDAINKGIKLASGDVIGLLHSDDLFADENVLEKYASVFNQPTTNLPTGQAGNKLQTIDAVYSDLVYVRKKQEVRSKKLEARNSKTTIYQLLTTDYSTLRYWKAGDPSTSLRMTTWIKNGWMPPHPTLFIKKEIFNKYGYYRTDMKIAADYEMILRLLFKHKITSYYLPVTTYLMSIGGASNKSLKNIIQKSKEDYLAMKMNGINFPVITLISKNLRKLPQFLARDL